jgi:phage-Barnase-EndoU-ColicinE5/D-RelE like nuclease3
VVFLLIFSELVLGELPTNAINKTLGLELENGLVVMSRAAQTHASRRHPQDFINILPHIAGVVTNPLYVGEDFKNKGKIELIGVVPGSSQFALVAIVVEKDSRGRYNIASFYPVSRSKIEGRKEKGFLQIMKR